MESKAFFKVCVNKKKNIKMKKYILIIITIFLLTACKQVGEIFNPKKPPELDEKGVVVSQNKVMPQDTILASIKATNPLNGPLEYEWHSDGGHYLQPADADSVYWVAPLSGGLYNLWVVVRNDDGEAESPKKQINVISSSKPIVNILEPEPRSYFVVSQEITVRVKAQHVNGIVKVSLWVNDQKTGETDQAQNNIFVFHFKASRNMVGETKVKAEAVARNNLSTTGSDQITILIGGIIPGGNEQ